MASTFSCGYAEGSDGRDVCIRAIDRAREAMGRTGEDIALAFIFAAGGYRLQDVLNGANAQLRDTPVVGLTAPALLTGEGQQDTGIAVALVAGRGLRASAGWWEPEGRFPARRADRILKQMKLEGVAAGALFLFADGTSDYQLELAEGLAAKCASALAGGLAAGHPGPGEPFLFGNREGGAGGACAAHLSGDVRIGIGVDHGWRPVGLYFKITRAEGTRILEIDREPPTAYFAKTFGQDTPRWLRPPLNELVRLYPIGLEQDSGGLLLRSPLRVEMDGSLRMTAPVTPDSTGHLLVSSAGACRQAVHRAAKQARESLGGGEPRMALVVADVAWQMLGEVQPIDIAGAVRQVAGADIPIAGCYTLGQLTRGQVLNQHIQVVFFSD